MIIAILSDIHDHRARLRQALALAAGCDMMICCGDLCSPFIMHDLGNGFSNPIHIVFGNNDGDQYRLTTAAAAYPHIVLHGEVAQLEVERLKIAVTHFDSIAAMLSTSPAYDVICFGHNHRYQVEQKENTLLINPGEIMGELTGEASLVCFDTASRQVEKMVIGDG